MDTLEMPAEAPERASCVSVPTALYRHFDCEGALLYVGISLNAVIRLSQHRTSSHWYRDIVRMEIEWLPTREAAELAEREAIAIEGPLHNVVHAGLNHGPLRQLIGEGRLHMVDENYRLLPAYASLEPGEAAKIAQRLG